MTQRPVDGVVVRHHLEEQVAVTGLRCENDSLHELGDADGADPGVSGPLQLLQVKPGVPVLAELVEDLVHPLLDGFLQLGELQKEVLVDSQCRHERSQDR
ncbi:hypothetical protein CD790_06320 [Streptomyces sp. SAJ15]|nr:hypothetical protein CD790_06320 [Streptomyces sp. SAJ15]